MTWPGSGQFGCHGHDWQDLYKPGPPDIAIHIKYKSFGSNGYREVFMFSHFKSMGTFHPREVENLVLGRIYVGDH